MSKIGSYVLLKVGDKLLIGQNSLSYKKTAAMIETSSKTSGKFSEFEYGRINTTLSVGGIASTKKEATQEGFHELDIAMDAHEKITCVFVEYTDETGVVEVSDAEKMTQLCLISNLTWDNPEDKSTFSCDLQISGQPVRATGTGTMAAPLGAADQIYDSGATVADLVAVGSLIKWYAASSGGSALATSVALVTDTHYYASQTINNVESTLRLDVHVALV